MESTILQGQVNRILQCIMNDMHNERAAYLNAMLETQDQIFAAFTDVQTSLR